MSALNMIFVKTYVMLM